MNVQTMLYATLAMAVVMYLMRVFPLIFCKEPIKNKFIQSFLSYIPFAVLTSMTIPEVFNSTSSPISAVIGFLTAVVLAYFDKGLLIVSVSATAVVFIVEQIMHMMV